MLIGRLITDEEFRLAYLSEPEQTLRALRDAGLEISPIEIAALVCSEQTIWARAAEAIDPRLQKASLKNHK